MKKLIHRRLRLRRADSGLQPGEKIHPIATPVVQTFPIRLDSFPHAEWHVDIRDDPQTGPQEPLRRDADHGEGNAIDQYLVAHNGAALIEVAGPIAMPQDRDWARPRSLVVIGREQAAGSGYDFEQRKI